MAKVRSDDDGLTRRDLADLARTTVESVDRLVVAGILGSRADGRFAPGDVHRIRIVSAFERAGVPVEVLAGAIETGAISLAYYDELHPEPSRPSSRTYEELGADLGPSQAVLLEQLLTALGVAAPGASDPLAGHDETLLVDMLAVLGSLARPDLGLRVARLFGESARRTSEAALDVYAEAVDDIEREASGLPSDEVYERFLRPWSRLAALAPRLAAWLTSHHLSAAIDAYSVTATEEVLERAGFVAPRDEAPPAVAFVDLTGFTRLTERQGDEAAAAMALRLATLAGDVAGRHDGRVVKLLGDGVLIRFGSPGDGVAGAAELLDRIDQEDLPAGHVGLAAGTLVVREGDIFGRTVNLAARLADVAGPNEIVLSEAAVTGLALDGFHRQPLESFELKGIAGPVRAVRLRRPPADRMASD